MSGICHRSIRMACCLGLVALLGACQTTQQSQQAANPVEPKKGMAFNMGGEVQHHLTRLFYDEIPECATVLPTAGKVTPAMARMVEESAFRFLHDRMSKAYGPRARAAAERRLVLDLEHAGDRRRFVAASGCSHFLRARVGAADSFYLLFWSERQVAIGLELSNAKGDLLWQAAHRVRRGDGGIPISPLSAGSALISAGLRHADLDQMPSMVDDAIRHMMTTLPDTRSFDGIDGMEIRLNERVAIRSNGKSQDVERSGP